MTPEAYLCRSYAILAKLVIFTHAVHVFHGFSVRFSACVELIRRWMEIGQWLNLRLVKILRCIWINVVTFVQCFKLLLNFWARLHNYSLHLSSTSMDIGSRQSGYKLTLSETIFTLNKSNKTPTSFGRAASNHRRLLNGRCTGEGGTGGKCLLGLSTVGSWTRV